MGYDNHGTLGLLELEVQPKKHYRCLMIEIYSYAKASEDASKKTYNLLEYETPNDHLDILKDINQILAQIPEENRHNLFFTAAHVFPKEENGKQRQARWQDLIPFDIDNVHKKDKGHWELYVAAISQCTNIPAEKFSVIWSGHGFHILLHVRDLISGDEITKSRPAYKKLCTRIGGVLQAKGLSGNVDDMMFRNAACIRMPGTHNIKEGRDPAMVQTLFIGSRADYKLNLKETIDTMGVTPEQTRIVPHDQNAVEEGCLFLKDMRENQETQTYPQWWNMLTVLAPFGSKKCHEYSSKYPGYKEEETQNMFMSIKNNYGPRFCRVIEENYEGCNKCPHHKEVNSPIDIKGPEFIATAKSGFRSLAFDAQGNSKIGKIACEDLYKKFVVEKGPLSYVEVEGNFIYNGKYYTPISKTELHAFVSKNVKSPLATDEEQKKFYGTYRYMNYHERDVLKENIGKANLLNGVYNFKTDTLENTSPKNFFTYQSPLQYIEEKIETPLFDAFLDQVLPDKDAQDLIWEYLGVGFAGVPNREIERALFLVGEGSNGKSVLLNTIMSVLGSDAYSSVALQQLKDFNYLLQGKVLNLSTESTDVVAKHARHHAQTFKNVLSGEPMTVNRKFKDPYMDSFNAKHIFAMNTMPNVAENTLGFFRRIMVIPFDVTIKEKNQRKGLAKSFIPEYSGIFQKIINGHKRWKEQGKHFTVPKVTLEGLDRMKQDDPVFQFVEEFLTITNNPEHFCNSRALYQSYLDNSQDMHKMNKATFIKGLKAHLTNDREFTLDLSQTKTTIRKINNKTTRGVSGIQILEDF